MRLVPLPNPRFASRRMFIGIHSPILPFATNLAFHRENTSNVHVASRSLYVKPPTRLHARCNSGAGNTMVTQRRAPERSEFEVHRRSEAPSNANSLRLTDDGRRRKGKSTNGARSVSTASRP